MPKGATSIPEQGYVPDGEHLPPFYSVGTRVEDVTENGAKAFDLPHRSEKNVRKKGQC